MREIGRITVEWVESLGWVINFPCPGRHSFALSADGKQTDRLRRPRQITISSIIHLWWIAFICHHYTYWHTQHSPDSHPHCSRMAFMPHYALNVSLIWKLLRRRSTLRDARHTQRHWYLFSSSYRKRFSTHTQTHRRNWTKRNKSIFIWNASSFSFFTLYLCLCPNSEHSHTNGYTWQHTLPDGDSFKYIFPSNDTIYEKQSIQESININQIHFHFIYSFRTFHSNSILHLLLYMIQFNPWHTHEKGYTQFGTLNEWWKGKRAG